jgi:hypothetical protein
MLEVQRDRDRRGVPHLPGIPPYVAHAPHCEDPFPGEVDLVHRVPLVQVVVAGLRPQAGLLDAAEHPARRVYLDLGVDELRERRRIAAAQRVQNAAGELGAGFRP